MSRPAHRHASSLSALLGPKHMPHSRPSVIILLGIVAAIALGSLTLTLVWARSESIRIPPTVFGEDPFIAPDSPAVPPHDPVMLSYTWRDQAAQWVNGDPTDSFQENLRTDMQYVSTWVSGGWTNDFMTYINLIYLGLLTGRTPIIPPFSPSHVDYDAGFPPFGDVFDLPWLYKSIGGSPLLEWRDVKRENSSHTDELGCWSIWSLVGEDGQPRHSGIPYHLKLDVSYTALPSYSERVAAMPSGVWLPFSSLADLSLQSRRLQALSQHPAQTGSLAPDAHLMCFDFMYYMGALHHDEWWEDWSPAWRIVGQHARWMPELERLGQGYVRRALDLPEDGEGFPPYVSVHVRRGDFTAACGGVPKNECFPPLSAYVRRVHEVRGVLLTEKGIDVPPEHVLVTSDETSAAWWDEVASLGWRRADHVKEMTVEKLGKWFVPLIDAVVQSRGVGFVGTDRSTMSLVAKRRVEDWQGGVGYLVRIGGRNADD